MNIFNVRFGFATNSSSTHSIVQIPVGVNIKDKDVSGSEFGWGDFVCASKESKQRYLAQQLICHFENQDDYDSINADYFKFLTGISENEFIDMQSGYLDHQSQIALPKNFNGHGLDIKFFKEFANFVLNTDIAILGGNDNNEYKHSLLGVSKEIKKPFFLDVPHNELVARWDSTSNYWTLFNRTSGTKVRFSFNSEQPPPECSEVPELVDIKITDKCFYNCPFCYQGSTAEGLEADSSYLYFLSKTLSDARVFEVALGGGEPTTYPRFTQVLQEFREKGIVPNFTTKSLDWFKDLSFVSILPKIGSFAFSAQTTRQIRQLRKTLDFYDDIINEIRPKPLRVNIHIVMGLHYDWEFRSLIHECLECGFTPILLGFKTTGRGESVNPKPYDNWLKNIQKVFTDSGSRCKIGLDTVMASEYADLLKDNEIPNYLYHTKEGVFSCYVDAVNKTLAESSFSGTPIKLSYDALDDFKELYKCLK